jgi:hypothetical protein
MRRKLFTLAAVVSAVLCVAACVLWVRSYSVSDHWYWYHPVSVTDLSLSRGSFYFRELTMSGSQVLFSLHTSGHESRTPPESTEAVAYLFRHGFAGFGIRRRAPGQMRFTDLLVPVWPLIVVSSLIPAAWLYAHRKRHVRRQAGRCSACGYDLRATPDRCPECGTVPAAKGAA